MNRARIESILFVLLIATSPMAATAQGADAAFADANTLYERSLWSAAAAEYHQILDAGIESGPLHLNLGSAYYQMGRTGEASYHFLRALRLDPSLSEARQNLLYLQGSNDLTSLLPSSRFLLFIQIGWIASLLFIVAAVVVTVRLRTRGTRLAGALLAVGILVAGGALAASAVGSRPVDIVTRGQAPAFATHDGLDRMGFDVPEGVQLRVIDRSGPRLLVETEGRRGWVDSYRVRSL